MKFLIFALVVANGLVTVQAQECACDQKEGDALQLAIECAEVEKPEKAKLEDDPTFSIQIVPEKHENETKKGEISFQITKRDAFTEEKETNKRERRELDRTKLNKCADKHLGKIDCYIKIKSDCEAKPNSDQCVIDGVKEAIEKCKEKNGGKKPKEE